MPSAYAAFRRTAVPQQLAQQLRTVMLPAPTRGLILNENESYMQPGAALVLDNWKPTMKGIGAARRLRQVVRSARARRTVPPFNSPLRKSVVSMFQYVSGNNHQMFAGTADQAVQRHGIVAGAGQVGTDVRQLLPPRNWPTRAAIGCLWSMTTAIIRCATTAPHGRRWTAPRRRHWANATVYDVGTPGDGHRRPFLLEMCGGAHQCRGRYTFSADRIAHPTFWARTLQATAPAGSPARPGPTVVAGHNLTYVWKYRNRWFFIEAQQHECLVSADSMRSAARCR